MTDFHHDHVVVYGELAGSLRLAKSARVFVTDTVTGVAVNVTQGARTAAYVDTDANGRATFTATVPNRLRLTNGATFVDVWPVEVVGPDDATVATLLGTASATRTAADGRYVQSTATQPINRGGTGQTTAPAALVALGGAPLSLTGTYAARPAANTVPAGTVYYCTNIPEQYRSDGTVWSVVGSGGNELGYAEILTVVSPSGTTPVDVAGLSVTFVAGERPIEAMLSSMVRVRDVGSLLWLYLVLDGTSKANAGTSLTFYQPTARVLRITGLTPGTTHTVKIQAAMPVAAGTGVGDIFGATDNPVSLTVRTR